MIVLFDFRCKQRYTAMKSSDRLKILNDAKETNYDFGPKQYTIPWSEDSKQFKYKSLPGEKTVIKKHKKQIIRDLGVLKKENTLQAAETLGKTLQSCSQEIKGNSFYEKRYKSALDSVASGVETVRLLLEENCRDKMQWQTVGKNLKAALEKLDYEFKDFKDRIKETNIIGAIKHLEVKLGKINEKYKGVNLLLEDHRKRDSERHPFEMSQQLLVDLRNSWDTPQRTGILDNYIKIASEDGEAGNIARIALNAIGDDIGIEILQISIEKKYKFTIANIDQKHKFRSSEKGTIVYGEGYNIAKFTPELEGKLNKLNQEMRNLAERVKFLEQRVVEHEKICMYLNSMHSQLIADIYGDLNNLPFLRSRISKLDSEYLEKKEERNNLLESIKFT